MSGSLQFGVGVRFDRGQQRLRRNAAAGHELAARPADRGGERSGRAVLVEIGFQRHQVADGALVDVCQLGDHRRSSRVVITVRHRW
jgi:hypothetical protein